MPQNQHDLTATTFIVKKEGLKVNGTPLAVGATTTAPGAWPNVAAHIAAGELAVASANQPALKAAASHSRIPPRGGIAQSFFAPADWRCTSASAPSDF